VNPSDIRHNWPLAEIESIYTAPLPELMYRAQTVHRAHHRPDEVQGWTSHHSIVEWKGKWWLFYADTQLSDKNHLRNVKMTELRFNPDGTIPTIDPFVK